MNNKAKSKAKSINYLLAGTLATLAPGLTYAQDDESIEKLDSTTVTGESAATGTPDVSVTADALQRIQATTLNDVFSKTPSVSVNGGRAQAQQVFVNGLESTLSNVTIDGATQGNLYHHAGSVLIDPELIKRVDVHAGAGNALQGLGALNGSVKFTTKNAFDFAFNEKGYAGSNKANYYSNGVGYRLSHTSAVKLSEQWGLLFSYGHTDRKSYRDGDGNVVDLTDYSSDSLLLKLSGRLSGGHSFDFGIDRSDNDTISFDRLNVSRAFLDATGRPTGLLQPIVLQRNTFTANYGFNPEGNDLVDLAVETYLSRQSYSREQSNEYSDLSSLGLTIKNTSRYKLLKSTYGLDYRRTSSDVRHAFLAPTVPVSDKETAYGFFLQNELDLTKQITLHLGGRYDSYDYTDIAGKSFKSSKFSPNAGITFKPLESLTFDAGYNEAYRGVGIRETFLPGARPVGLDGEEAKTFKVSATFQKGGFFAKGSYFDQSIDNYLNPIAPGRRGPNGVKGDIQNHGYEFTVGYTAGAFSTSLSVSDNDPSVDGYDYPDDLGLVVGGRRWIATAAYTLEDLGLTFGGNIEYREKVDEVPLGRFPAVAAKDSYALVNTFVKWDVKQVEGLSVSLNINNLLDKQYQDHTIYTASGLASPGREARIGVTYEF